MNKIIIIILIFCFTSVHAQQQNRTIDSLANLLRKEKIDSTKVILMMQIGDAYNLLKTDSAFNYYQEAFDLSRKLKVPMLEIMASSGLAGIYNTMGNYPEALKLSLASLKIEEQIHDTNFIFFTKREIIWTYYNIGDFEKALELAKEWESFANSGYFKDQEKIKLYQSMVYINLANIYQELKYSDSALHYKILSYQLAQQSKDPQWLALATSGLADMYYKLDNVDSAFYYNRLCISYAFQAGRTDMVRGSRFEMAHLFQKIGKLDSAFYYAYRGLNEFKNVPDTAKIMDASLLISQLYNSKKQFDSAYIYLAYHDSLKEKSLTDEKIKKVQNLAFNDILYQKQLEQQRKETQQQFESRLKIYSLLAGLGVLLLLAIILYGNNKQKQKAKAKIEKAYENLKSTQSQLIQSEKMASLGELTAGIAHEIQNPLNFVNNFSEVNKELMVELKDEIEKGNADEVSAIADNIISNEEKINHHGKRADAIVKNMLQHSRTNTGQKELTDINALCDEYLRLSYHGLRAKDKSFNAELKTDFDESIGKINIIPQDIGRVLLNLFNNAFYAVSEKKNNPRALKGTGEYEPEVTVTTRAVKLPAGGLGVLLTVTDNGNGIPQNVIDKIFQPFFTTKPTGEGTGLGLSLSYDIITKEHNGIIKAKSKEGEGTEFIIQLQVI